MFDQKRDVLRVPEMAVRATLDALLQDLERVQVRDPMAREALGSCIAHVSQLYQLARYRAYAKMEDTLMIHRKTGLPSSVEISKVYHDTTAKPASGATLVAEKAAIVEHILNKNRVPEPYVDKAVRTAYGIHAAKVDLMNRFWVATPEKEGDYTYWCSWFHHMADGQFALYLMRFEMDWSVADASEVLERAAHEARNGSMTSPGVFGARLDESITELFPKEVHAWFVRSLASANDLADAPDSEWLEDEFMVSIQYEQARSSGEQSVSRGLFGTALRQIWETEGDQDAIDRLVRRQKKLVVAPHTVLQRRSDFFTSRSIVPVMASLNDERKSHEWT